MESAGIVFDFDRRVHHRRRALRGVAFEVVAQRNARERASGLAARANPRGRVELHVDAGRECEVHGVQERGFAALVIADKKEVFPDRQCLVDKVVEVEEPDAPDVKQTVHGSFPSSPASRAGKVPSASSSVPR